MGAGCCLSDWLENICMNIIVGTYPAEPMPVAVLAVLLTSLKYLFLLLTLAFLSTLAFKHK